LAAALKNMHNETVPLDIKDELSSGLISAAIHGQTKFIGLIEPGTWAAQTQAIAFGPCKLPWLLQGCGLRCEQGLRGSFPRCVQRAVPPALLDDFRGPEEVPGHSPIPSYGGHPLPLSLPVGAHPCLAPRHTWCWGRYSCEFGAVDGRGEGRHMRSPVPVDLVWWISSGSAPSTSNPKSRLLSLCPSLQPLFSPAETRLIPS